MNHLENMLVTPTAVVGARVRRHTLMAFTGSIPPILLINQTNNRAATMKVPSSTTSCKPTMVLTGYVRKNSSSKDGLAPGPRIETC
jgi:hypothetical protein